MVKSDFSSDKRKKWTENERSKLIKVVNMLLFHYGTRKKNTATSPELIFSIQILPTVYPG